MASRCICRHWRKRRGTTFDHPLDLATQYFRDQPISAHRDRPNGRLMPLRAITNISVMICPVTGRGLAIAAQVAMQSLVMFLSTLAALFEFNMGGTSLCVGALCGQFAAMCVG